MFRTVSERFLKRSNRSFPKYPEYNRHRRLLHVTYTVSKDLIVPISNGWRLVSVGDVISIQMLRIPGAWSTVFYANFLWTVLRQIFGTCAEIFISSRFLSWTI